MAIAVVAMILMAGVGWDYSRRVSRSRLVLPAVAGYQHACQMDDDDGMNADLADDQGQLGMMWARHNHPRLPNECPSYSRLFRRGCEAYLRAQVDPRMIPRNAK